MHTHPAGEQKEINQWIDHSVLIIQSVRKKKQKTFGPGVLYKRHKKYTVGLNKIDEDKAIRLASILLTPSVITNAQCRGVHFVVHCTQ